MNQKRTMFVLFVCLVTSLVGCGRRTLQNTLFEGNEYVLEFPDSWEIQSQFQGADMVGISPQESPDDSFRENVTVVLENMPASMTDQEYLDLSASQLKQTFNLPGDIGFTPTRVGHMAGHHISYVAEIPQGTMDNDAYIVIHGGAVYVITCAHPLGGRDAMKSTMDGIIATFNIK